MHLVAADRAHRRPLDAPRVCEAIAALPDPAERDRRARRFALLGDPTRLALLTCINAAGPISVTDLTVATGLTDTTVSQALRLLRAHHAVTTQRDGRVIRYQLDDPSLRELLDTKSPSTA